MIRDFDDADIRSLFTRLDNSDALLRTIGNTIAALDGAVQALTDVVRTLAGGSK